MSLCEETVKRSYNRRYLQKTREKRPDLRNSEMEDGSLDGKVKDFTDSSRAEVPISDLSTSGYKGCHSRHLGFRTSIGPLFLRYQGM